MDLRSSGGQADDATNERKGARLWVILALKRRGSPDLTEGVPPVEVERA